MNQMQWKTWSLLSTIGAISSLTFGSVNGGAIAQAQQPLFVAYPPDGHETVSDQIFLIGTAPSDGEVRVNGRVIERSPAGHFAPSVPLQFGENRFTLTYGNQTLQIQITRTNPAPLAPAGVTFAEGSLAPAVDIARLPGDLICFEAIAPSNADVAVTMGSQILPLMPQVNAVTLPPNSAVLTFDNQPVSFSTATTYQGCTTFDSPAVLGQPIYHLKLDGQQHEQQAAGSITILSATPSQIARVTAASGTARTGPSTDYSRLSPLPTGTQAQITGQEGDWYRLDYGAWIRAADIEVQPGIPPRSLIRSIQARQSDGWTELYFPLQLPVPVSVEQGGDTFTLTLHNTIAQTDTILLNDDPLIERLDWNQPNPDRINYRFQLKTDQQWGYKLRYEGTTLVLSLRHPPQIGGDSPSSDQLLQGISILLDPGHGSDNDLGARGPTGYPEKDVTLLVSRLLRDQLVQRGATVVMTREGDEDLYPGDRVEIINQLEPTLALSIHYNALPDNGDAINTAGIGTFWYHTQAHDLAVFLHNYLAETLDRPSYGVFWNNLALTRPSVAPSVLLELGFMINPNEFEWIVDPAAQQQLAETLADGIVAWVRSQASSS
jgi:N-acetylmuramoyl-L-alanine amidase